MNTTSLYVEPLLVGGMVGATVLLPFYPELAHHPELSKWWGGQGGNALARALGAGTTLTAMAYIIGITADRLLDSLLEPISRHFRLWFSLKSTNQLVAVAEHRDPFPDDRYQAEIMLKDSGSAIEWLHYVRTRVRIARAFLFVLPGLTFAAPPALLRLPNSQLDHDIFLILLVSTVPIAWLLMALLAVILPQIEQRFARCSGCAGRWKPPRTDNFEKLSQYMRARNVYRTADNTIAAPWREKLWDIVLQPFPIGALALFVATACLAIIPGGSGPLGFYALIVGTLATLAAGFAWRRTSETHMTYVRMFGERLATDGDVKQ